MRYALLMFALAACSPDASSTTAPRLVRPSFALDLTPPAAPSGVSAAVTADDGVTATVHVQWQDNTAALDEYVTCARFTTATEPEQPVTTQCAWAQDYDLPAGSTGVRSADVFVPTGGPYLVRMQAARWFLQDDGYHRSVFSAESDAAAVSPLASVAATAKRKGKH